LEVVGTWYSLVPPILALILVLLTRKVLLSLGIGIAVGAFMLNDLNLVTAVQQVFGIIRDIFYVDGAINNWEFYIIIFLLLLGMTASLITKSGGSRAFANWAIQRIKTRVGAQLFTIALGFIIFIDDYFTSLTVGTMSRPLSDKYRVSRAKLAYLVDSSAAPMSVIAPISSWGAYIISIVGGILATHSVTQYKAFEAFVVMIPMNYYAVLSLLFIIVVAIFQIDFGPMKRHEQMAMDTGQLTDPASGPVPGVNEDIQSHEDGKVRDLLLPILGLVIGTVVTMLYTGYQAAESTSLIAIFGEADIAGGLVAGGVIGVVIALVLNLVKKDNAGLLPVLWSGAKSMLPAIYILILAWTIISIISDLGTGEFLANLVDGHIPPALLPAMLFLIAAFTAISTGTSWGTFGLLLPIAGDMAATADVNLMLPMLAAVLAGAVFGDHASPISDTTILSSAGTGVHHIDHVMTQLPYAIVIALVSVVGFIILGVTGQVWLSLVAVLGILAVTAFVLKRIFA
jgi:tetracycline resistance efflux pump